MIPVFNEAGGYDERVPENVEHLLELKECVRSLGLDGAVEFRPNIGDGGSFCVRHDFQASEHNLGVCFFLANLTMESKRQ